MRYDSWIARSSDGRSVEFAYKELSDGTAAISAKTDATSVMIVQQSIKAPLTRKQVEDVFEHEGLEPCRQGRRNVVGASQARTGIQQNSGE